MAAADEKTSIIRNGISISHCTRRITKIMSGVQTGGDHAPLDAAIENGIAHDSWIPQGRKAQTALVPEKYKRKEMEIPHYPKRTEQNVIDSDGTLIVSPGQLTGGFAYTREMTENRRKPWIHFDAYTIPIKKAIKLIGTWI